MVLDEVAKQNGHRFAFRFNTYIVSVLVIFYLQLNHNFPKLEVLAPSRNKFNDHVPQVDAKHLKQAVQQFFEFYGKKYEKCKLISLNFGRWQNQKLDKKQHIISPERKKLVRFYAVFDIIFNFPFDFKFRIQEAINSNEENWKNCTMYVQDIKSPGINVTAELTEVEVDSFKAICKMFTSASLLDESIDEYTLKLSQVRSSSSTSTVNNNVSQKVNNEIAQSEHICEGASSTLNNNIGEKLEDAISIVDVVKLSRIEMHDILTRSTSRINSEEEIIDQFSFLLVTFDPDITVAPYGSVTFGFGGQRIDFNILITAGKIHSI